MQFFHSISMAPPIWPLLFLLQILLAWAGPLSTASLTPNLAKVIPSCAQSCVESFVAENYKAACGPPPNFDCLCVNNTPSGFTVGEGSLECLFSSCHDVEDSVLASVYAVCIRVPDARPNTHTILTATGPSVASPTSTASPTESSGDTSSSIFPSKSHTSSSLSTSASSAASRYKSTITTKTSSSSLHSSALYDEYAIYHTYYIIAFFYKIKSHCSCGINFYRGGTNPGTH